MSRLYPPFAAGSLRRIRQHIQAEDAPLLDDLDEGLGCPADDVLVFALLGRVTGAQKSHRGKGGGGRVALYGMRIADVLPRA